MMRSFVVALVTIAGVGVLGSSERLAATSQPQPAGGSFSYPVDIVGGTPGVNLEMFLNNGKVADVAVGSGGDANWVLDLSNVGKIRVTVYVDVCKDGKIVKVAFVTGGGQAPPEDEGCDRRIGGVGWWSDCGVTRITINIRTWGARVIGCTPFYQRPPFIGAAGALVVLPFVFGGGEGPTAIGTPLVAQQPTVVAPPVVTTNTTTPAPPSTPAPVDFNVTLTSSYNHPGGNTSVLCILIVTSPPQAAGAYLVTFSGPGIVSGGSSSGTLNSAGRALVQAIINAFGSYNGNVSVTSSGATRTATGSINVVAANSSCPAL